MFFTTSLLDSPTTSFNQKTFRPLYCSVLRPTCSSDTKRLRSVLEPLFVKWGTRSKPTVDVSAETSWKNLISSGLGLLLNDVTENHRMTHDLLCTVCHWSVLVTGTPIWDNINAILTFCLCFSCCACCALLHISIVSLCLLIWSRPSLIDVICYMWNDPPGTLWICTSPLVCTHMKGASESWMVRYVWSQVWVSSAAVLKRSFMFFFRLETNAREREREYHFINMCKVVAAGVRM